MPEIIKVLKLDKRDYYETHLAFLNCILPKKLTPMEVKVLAAFMSLEGDIGNVRFGPSAKKIIMSQLDLKPAGLSNYMISLLSKGFLIKKVDNIEILPILLPQEDEQTYKFKLIKNATNNT